MIVKKAGGKIFGAYLTNAERTAMHLEIQRELAEFDKKHMLELDAVVLYCVKKYFGVGEKKLHEFYETFSDELEALIRRYELEHEDKVWMCTHALKEDGIDIFEWDRKRHDTQK